jgi:hypothetical protein
MENSDQLSDLIASMTSAERQYFRKYAATHALGGGNHYLSLFENLAAGRKSRGAVAASAGHYLQTILLRSLRSFHAQASAGMELRGLLDTLELIFEKRQLKLAARQIERGLQLAAELGEPAMTLALCKWQRRLLRRNANALQPQDMARLQQQEELALNQYLQEIKAIQLHDANFAATHKGAEKTSLEAWEGIEMASFDGALALETTRGVVAQSQGKDVAALDHFWQNLQIWHRFPRRIQDHPRRYTAALINYLRACHALNHFEGFDKVMDSIQNLPFRDDALRLEIECKCLHLLLVLHLNNYDLTAANSTVKQLLEMRDRKDKPMVLAPDIHYSLAAYFFLAGPSRSAIRHLEALITVRRSLANPERRDAARLLELLIYIDLDDDELAATRLRSLLRVQAKLAFPPWGLPIIRQLAALLRLQDPKRRRQHYADMQTQMDGYKGTKGLAFEELRLWLKAKASGTPLLQVVAEAAKGLKINP